MSPDDSLNVALWPEPGVSAVAWAWSTKGGDDRTCLARDARPFVFRETVGGRENRERDTCAAELKSRP